MTRTSTTPLEVPVVDVDRPREEPAAPVIAKGTREDVADRVPQARAGGDVEERVTLIAHDLKTPLSIILLESQLLGERFSADPAVQHSLERIEQNAAYIDRLIADLLDLASVDAGQLQLRLERVDLGELLHESIERAVSSIDRGRVQLRVRHPAFVCADRNRLERVIANLVGNALKYSASPVVVTIDRARSRARVTVTDRGRGLTPDQSRTIFDRYRRAGDTRARDGHGLGLYISRKIIDAHAGRIGVVSSPGNGSEFFFELDTIP